MHQSYKNVLGEHAPEPLSISVADNNNKRIDSLRQICTIIRAISLPNLCS